MHSLYVSTYAARVFTTNRDRATSELLLATYVWYYTHGSCLTSVAPLNTWLSLILYSGPPGGNLATHRDRDNLSCSDGSLLPTLPLLRSGQPTQRSIRSARPSPLPSFVLLALITYLWDHFPRFQLNGYNSRNRPRAQKAFWSSTNPRESRPGTWLQHLLSAIFHSVRMSWRTFQAKAGKILAVVVAVDIGCPTRTARLARQTGSRADEPGHACFWTSIIRSHLQHVHNK